MYQPFYRLQRWLRLGLTSLSVLSWAVFALPGPAQEAPLPTASPAAIPAEPTRVPTPPLPLPAPDAFAPNPAGIVDLTEDREIDLGIGHLRPQDLSFLTQPEDYADQLGVGWLQTVELPLYVSPEGPHWGWLYRGWLIPNGQPYLAIGRDAGFAMLRSFDNLLTFPVLEIRQDGWFRVQYTPGGSAWAHTSQLNLGDLPLTVETWEDRLESEAALYFRQAGGSRVLRSQPAAATNVISFINDSSLMAPLAFDGDWMRVRVTRPAAACQPLTGARSDEGWIRWRSEAGSALVWYRPECS